MFVSDHQKDLDLFLNGILFAYRTSPHAGTKETPFNLLYGRRARLPHDVSILPPSSVPPTVQAYRDLIVENVQNAQTLAKELTLQAKQNVKLMYDEKAEVPSFYVGQAVLVYTPKTKKGLSKNFLHSFHWHGPYYIKKKLFEVHYSLTDGSGKSLKSPVHANRMKPYTDPNNGPTHNPPAEPSDKDKDNNEGAVTLTVQEPECSNLCTRLSY